MAVDPKFLEFQKNLRTTATGVKFGRTLFTNPDSMTPQQIAETMRALGMNIPREVEMTVQAAQAISTGSTIVENYQTAQDVQSVTSSSAASIRALNQIGQQNGWIDDETASAIRIGTSAAQIYASGGMDVSAWMSLAMEFYVTDLRLSAQAQTVAQKWVVDTYRGIVSRQAEALGSSIHKLLKNEVSPFGFLVEAADYSPALFQNIIGQKKEFQFLRDMFPGLAFLPTFTDTIYSRVSASNWYGMSNSGSFEISFQSLAIMDRRETVDFLMKNLIEPIAGKFLQADRELRFKGHMTLMDYLILATVEMKSFSMANDTYWITQLVKNRLTLGDFGYYVVASESRQREDVALNFDGKTKKFVRLTREQLNYAQSTGRMEILAKDKDSRSAIEKFIQISDIPIDPEIRDLRNYLSVLDFMDMVFKSGVSGVEENQTVQSYALLGTTEKFSQKLNHVQSLSAARKVNTLALSNVAFFLGAKDSTKIQNISGLREGAGSVFRRVE